MLDHNSEYESPKWMEEEKSVPLGLEKLPQTEEWEFELITTGSFHKNSVIEFNAKKGE